MSTIEKSTFLSSYPDIKTLFQSLDAPFLKFDRNHVEPIVWHAKDFNIQTRHEVRVPAVAGSTVKYTFSTVNGDISFGLQYATPGNLVEIIRETMREPSDVEPIKGSYKADYDGVFVFIFDNSFSWFTDKLITYDITLLQPAFAMADSTRSMQCRRMLSTMSEDTRKAEVTLLTSRERYSKLANEISTIEAKIAALTQELNNKKAIVKTAEEEVNEMEQKIKYNEAKKTGLCIRSLEKKPLSHVLSFLGKDSSAYHTCKYWKACIEDLPKNDENCE